MLEVIILPDVPQRLGAFGNIHSGSLVRKPLMDLIHIELIIPALGRREFSWLDARISIFM